MTSVSVSANGTEQWNESFAREHGMIIWSIGLIPVQEWIAEARRSRDLKVGSALLSWFMAASLDELTRAGAHVAVPAVGASDLERLAAEPPSSLLTADYGIPNRASGWWPVSLDDGSARLGALQGIIDGKWSELSEAALREMAISELKPYAKGIPNPIRVVWSARTSSNANGMTLGAAELRRSLEQCEALYSSVKRTRPITGRRGHPVPKCVQCGKREAAGPDRWLAWRSFWRKVDSRQDVRSGFRIDPGEHLCGVCLLKRFAGYLSDAPFPSTSEIAARDWLFRVRTFDDLRALIDEAKRRAREIDQHDPYPFLYERTLERLRLTAPDREDRDQAASLQDSLREIAKKIEDDYAELPSRPSNYLTVITFDGDDMGHLVQKHPETVPPALLDFSRQLSRFLGEFRATGFYLGGDEGLILCPIETCLALAAHIRDSFHRHMADIGANSEQGSSPTISVGLAVFDRERPLSAAIQGARRALKTAKDLEGKNALGVTVTTASGNSWTAVDHWGEGWDRTLAAIELTRANRLSTGWAYDIEALLKNLPTQFFARDEALEALREEVRRISYRRVKVSPEANRADDRARAVAREKAEVWERLQGHGWWSGSQEPEQLQRLTGQLHLIGFFARQTGPAMSVAGGEAEAGS